MAGSVTFNISPTVLQWARVQMGYTVEETASKIGVNTEKYKSWESGENKPTYKQLENLAEKVYKRPIAILLLSQPPFEEKIQKDFRNLSNSEVLSMSPELRLALRKAKRYQYILEEVSNNEEESLIKNFEITQKESPEKLALRLRNHMNFPLSEQLSWKHEDAFRNFQKKVESLGVYVFKMKLNFNEARAFCLTGEFPIIVLNTEDTNNGRIFSLFHELCHILLNTNDLFKDTKKNSIKQYEQIEFFCNQFAASFLVPESEFQQWVPLDKKDALSESRIETLAIKFKVSREVIARKLISNKLLNESDFWRMKTNWDRIAQAAKKKQNEKLKDSDSGINQGIKILYEKGKPYVSKVYDSYAQGIISSSDLSNFLETKLTNIPKILERINY